MRIIKKRRLFGVVFLCVNLSKCYKAVTFCVLQPWLKCAKLLGSDKLFNKENKT